MLTQERIDYLKTIWPPKTRKKGGAIHFGYKLQEGGDPLSLEPVWELLDLLEQALDKLDAGMSLRDASRWLTEVSGRVIGYQGIDNIWKEMRDNPDNPRSKRNSGHFTKVKPKTVKDKIQRRRNKEAGILKRKKINLEKRIQKMENAKKEKEEHIPVAYTEYEEIPETDVEPIFKPNEGPQTAFLASSEQEVLYGGAAGGGKSYAMIVDPLRYVDNPLFNGLLLRRTNDELRKLIKDSQFLYPKLHPKAQWKEKMSTWVFPSGAQLWMTYLDRDEDVTRYQGQEFCWIGIDELTQYPTPYAWNYLRSRLRTSSNSGLPLCMRATSNPGGVGHGWVKRMFIEPSPPNKAFPARDIETGEELKYKEDHHDPKKAGKPLFYRKFIPARVSDNPYLWEDGQYEANLLSLPDAQRRQLLEGDWDIADGAAFSEFRQKYHVIEPRPIPHDWKRFRSCDFGYSTYSAVHWFAIDPTTNTLIVYRELYVSKNTARDLARKILELEKDEKISYGVLDSSCWQVRGHAGPTIAEEMTQEGCRWRPADRAPTSRTNGKNRLHELLKVDPFTGRAGIEFFNTCRQIISDLPVIPAHPDGKEDIDDRYASDHAYDSIRYGIMSRPRAEDPWVEWIKSPAQNPRSGNPRASDTVFGY